MYLPITQVVLELTDLSWDPRLGVWVFANCEVLWNHHVSLLLDTLSTSKLWGAGRL